MVVEEGVVLQQAAGEFALTEAARLAIQRGRQRRRLLNPARFPARGRSASTMSDHAANAGLCSSRRWDRVSCEPDRASEGQAPPAARRPNQGQYLELAVRLSRRV